MDPRLDVARLTAVVAAAHPLLVGDVLHEALQQDAERRAAGYDHEHDYPDWLVWTAIYERAEALAERASQQGAQAIAALLIALIGERRAGERLTT